MKFRFSFLFLFLSAQITFAQVNYGPVIHFDSTIYNFGTVVQGVIINYDFPFINTGDSMLLITEVHGSAGSVVPSFPSEPIPPGKAGIIHVRYSTEGNNGLMNKTVTVTSNSKSNPVVLHIT